MAALPYAEGFNVPVGFVSNYALRFSTVTHKGAPFPPCVDQKNATSFSLPGDYSLSVRGVQGADLEGSEPVIPAFAPSWLQIP